MVYWSEQHCMTYTYNDALLCVCSLCYCVKYYAVPIIYN